MVDGLNQDDQPPQSEEHVVKNEVQVPQGAWVVGLGLRRHLEDEDELQDEEDELEEEVVDEERGGGRRRVYQTKNSRGGEARQKTRQAEDDLDSGVGIPRTSKALEHDYRS